MFNFNYELDSYSSGNNLSNDIFLKNLLATSSKSIDTTVSMDGCNSLIISAECILITCSLIWPEIDMKIVKIDYVNLSIYKIK